MLFQFAAMIGRHFLAYGRPRLETIMTLSLLGLEFTIKGDYFKRGAEKKKGEEEGE